MKKHLPWAGLCLTVSMFVLLIAHFYSLSVTTISQHMPISRTHTIIIDAGHGGEDGGASSPDGIPESTYNLNIALKLEKLFQFLGLETLMIRSSDISIYSKGHSLAEKKRSDLSERVRIVNSIPNSILLSIHQNHFSDSQYHGAQVFYAGTPGSKELAAALQSSFLSAINPGSNRKIKKANGIYLMEHIQRPGVLIECGFLSNPSEEKLLRSDTYQKKIACVTAVTVSAFLKGIENQTLDRIAAN